MRIVLDTFASPTESLIEEKMDRLTKWSRTAAKVLPPDRGDWTPNFASF
jgi:hypothetical protein